MEYAAFCDGRMSMRGLDLAATLRSLERREQRPAELRAQLARCSDPRRRRSLQVELYEAEYRADQTRDSLAVLRRFADRVERRSRR